MRAPNAPTLSPVVGDRRHRRRPVPPSPLPDRPRPRDPRRRDPRHRGDAPRRDDNRQRPVALAGDGRGLDHHRAGRCRRDDRARGGPADPRPRRPGTVGAVATDPRGLRTRIELGTGEIVVERWLTDTGSTLAARTPEGWRTISIGRRDASSPSVISSTSITRSTVDGSPPARSSSWPPTPTSGWPYLPTSWAMWSEHRGRPGLFRYSAADQRQPG